MLLGASWYGDALKNVMEVLGEMEGSLHMLSPLSASSSSLALLQPHHHYQHGIVSNDARQGEGKKCDIKSRKDGIHQGV